MLARLYPLRLVTSHTFLYKKLDEYGADHDKEVLDNGNADQDDNVYGDQGVVGDQLSVERAINGKINGNVLSQWIY